MSRFKYPVDTDQFAEFRQMEQMAEQHEQTDENKGWSKNPFSNGAYRILNVKGILALADEEYQNCTQRRIGNGST